MTSAVHQSANRMPSIQGLRAIALLGVLLFHAGVSWLDGGFIGVDIFFVISGYVIGLSIKRDTERGTFSFSDFYQRRAWRLLPALGFTLIGTAMVFGYLMPESANADLFGSLISSAFGLSNFVFVKGSDYFDSGISNPVLHTWSLGVEEQFYLVFPILIWISTRIWKQSAPIRILLLVLMILGFVAAVVATHNNKLAAFYLPWFRYWEFMAGAVLAYCRLDLVSAKMASLLSLIGASLLGLAMHFYTEKYIFPGVGALIPVLGTSILIVGLAKQNIIGRILGSRPLTFIGDISYSVYLVHWPIVCLIGMFLSLGSAKTQLLIVVLSIVSGYGFWALIENNFRSRFLNRRVGFKFLTAPILMCTSAVSVLFMLKITQFIWDKNPDAAAHFAAANESKDLYRVGTCFINERTLFVKYSESICLSTSAERENVLVIGDSLAANIVLALQEKDPARHYLQATAVNFRPGNDAKWPNFTVQLNQLLNDKYIVDAQKIHQIILFARWDADDLLPLRIYIEELNRRGFKVMVLGPSPEFYAGVPLILAHSALLKIELSGYFFKRDRINLDSIFRKNLEGVAGYVSMIDRLCPAGNCELEFNGNSIYSDKVHLTAVGVEFLAARLSEANLFRLYEYNTK